jgi:hypothetical protein
MTSFTQGANMYGHRLLGSLILASAVVAPVASYAAAPAPTLEVRVYDSRHKDYHVWDNREDQRYRLYLGNHHRKYRGYSSLNHKQQTTYWTWRHSPDGSR